MQKSFFLLIFSALTCGSLSAENQMDYDAISDSQEFDDAFSSENEERDFDEDLYGKSISDSTDTSNTETTPSSSSADGSPYANQDYPGMNRPNSIYSGAPYPSNGIHLAAFGEFLYWTSGYNFQNAVFGHNTTTVNRTLPSFSNHYQPGFRLGLQTALSAQGWDIEFDWVRFHNHKKKTFINDPADGKQLFLAWSNQYNDVFTEFDIDSETATWTLNYNQLDLSIGKEIFVSKYFSFRPNMGGRYIWVRDQFKLVNSSPSVNLEDTIKMKNHMHAFGFVFGLDNRFLLGYGLSIIGNVGAGLVYGPNHVHYLPIATTPSASTFLGSNVKFQGRDVTPVIDTRIDLGWERSFLKEKLGLELYIGYEYHVLINGFIGITVPDSGSVDIYEVTRTNLYMQGMNLGAKISF